MGKGLRYGSRFSNGSVSGYTGGYINHIRVGKVPKVSLTEKSQETSLKHRAKAGIKPSMPRFSWDEPPAEPPAPKGPGDAIARIELQLEGSKVEGIELENDHHIIFDMANPEGRPFKACWNKKNSCITWLEGRHKPPHTQRNRVARSRSWST